MSEEILNEVGRLAELQFSDTEIALITQIDLDEFELLMQDHKSPLFQKVVGGRLKTEAELRQILVKLSKQGSTPAQSLLLKLIKDCERKNFINA